MKTHYILREPNNNNSNMELGFASVDHDCDKLLFYQVLLVFSINVKIMTMEDLEVSLFVFIANGFP